MTSKILLDHSPGLAVSRRGKASWEDPLSAVDFGMNLGVLWFLYMTNRY